MSSTRSTTRKGRIIAGAAPRAAKSQPNYPCPDCGEVFATPQARYGHRSMKHRTTAASGFPEFVAGLRQTADQTLAQLRQYVNNIDQALTNSTELSQQRHMAEALVQTYDALVRTLGGERAMAAGGGAGGV
ncbi:MAG TPA: hypothetical protein VFA33_07715 [Bryobacteraceae bacterium]|nr:hypothetical protein [Bryobacteraceae bacterium]